MNSSRSKKLRNDGGDNSVDGVETNGKSNNLPVDLDEEDDDDEDDEEGDDDVVDEEDDDDDEEDDE